MTSNIVALKTLPVAILPRVRTLPPEPEGPIHIAQKAFQTFTSQRKVEALNTFFEVDPNELTSCPLLDAPSSFPLGDTYDDQIRLFAHIHGDTLIKNTRLESSSEVIMASVLLSLIKSGFSIFKESFSKIEEELEEFINIYDKLQKLSKSISASKNKDQYHQKILPFALEIAQKVFRLTPGKALLLPGGWENHAVLWRIERNNDNTYNIIIYNTGRGIKSFHNSNLQNFKVKVTTALIYEKVKPEQLFLSDSEDTLHPDLFIHLFALKAIPSANYSIPSHPSDFYRAFSHLHGREVPLDDVLFSIMTPQRAGICAFKVFLAYLLCNIPKEKYKIFKYDLKLHSLIKFHQLLQQIDHIPYEAHFLLEESCKKFLRRLNKMHLASKVENANIDHLYEHFAACKIILFKLHNHASAFSVTNKLSSNLIRWRNDQEKTVDLSKIIPEGSKGPPKIPFIAFEPPYSTPVLPSPIDVLKCLNQFKEAYLTKISFNDQTIRFLIRHLVDQMEIPLPKNHYWKQISTSDIERIFHILYEMLERYTTIVLPQKMDIDFLTVNALLAIIHTLACRIDNELKPQNEQCNLSEYKLFFPFISEVNYNLYDIKDLQRLGDIYSYFCSGSRLPFLFNFFNHQKITPNHLSLLPDFRFFDNLISKNVGILNNIKNKVKRKIKPKKNPKFADYCELLVDLGGPNSVLEPHYPHYIVLKKATFLSLLFRASTRGSNSSELQMTEITRSDTSLDETSLALIFQYHMFLYSGVKLYQNDYLTFKEQFLAFSSIFETHTNDVLEAKAMLQKNKVVAYSRLCCAPFMVPFSVLKFYLDNIHLLEYYLDQNFIEIQLFKSYQSKDAGKIIYPLIKLCTDNFKELFLRFIKQGLNQFYLLQPAQQPVLDPCLFLFRLIQQTEKLYQTIHQEEVNLFPSAIAILQQWLSLENISLVQKSLIHLHLILLYSNHKNELENEEPELLSNIIKSWIFYRNNDQSGNKKNLDEEARYFIFSIAENLKNLSKKYPKVVEDTFVDVLKSLDIHLEKGGHWVYSFPDFTWALKPSFWKINILTGEIISQHGLLKGTNINPVGWYLFNYLFKSRQYYFRKSNHLYYFVTPHLGSIRIEKEEDQPNQIKDPILDRLNQDGKWYRYLPTEKLQNILPKPLIADHSVWFELSEIDQPKANLEFSRLEILNKDGQLIGIKEPHQGISLLRWPQKPFLSGGKVIRTDNPDLIRCLETFDPNKYILWVYTPLSTYVLLTRYKSINESILGFETDKNHRLMWNENRDYLLEHPLTEGPFSTLSHHISMINLSNQTRKVLVPCHNAFTEDNNHVNFENVQHKIAYEYFSPQMGSEYYLEYTLIGSHTESESIEGWFYLCYINLIQKRPEEGHAYFQRISQVDSLSPLSQKIITWIFATPRIELPNASALRLKIHSVLEEKFQNLLLGDLIKSVSYKIENDYSNYLQNLNNISESLRLTLDEEKLLLGHISKTEYFAQRRKIIFNSSSSLFNSFSPSSNPNSPQNWLPLPNYVFLGNSTENILIKENATGVTSLLKCLSETKDPVTIFPFITNGDEINKSFRTLFSMAVSDKEIERKKLKLYLQLIRKEKLKDEDDETSSWHNMLLGYIQFVYEQPKRIEPIPPHDSSIAIKKRWLLSLHNLAKRYNPPVAKTTRDNSSRNELGTFLKTIPPVLSKMLHTTLLDFPNFSTKDLESYFVLSAKETFSLPTFELQIKLDEGEKNFEKGILEEIVEFNLDLKKGYELLADQKEYLIPKIVFTAIPATRNSR